MGRPCSNPDAGEERGPTQCCQLAVLIVLSAASLACVGASGSRDAAALCIAALDILLIAFGLWLMRPSRSAGRYRSSAKERPEPGQATTQEMDG